jgi:hypothetical protein
MSHVGKFNRSGDRQRSTWAVADDADLLILFRVRIEDSGELRFTFLFYLLYWARKLLANGHANQTVSGRGQNMYGQFTWAA